MRTLLKLVLALALAASALLWGINLIFAVEQIAHVALLGLKPAAVPYLARVDLSTVTPLVLVLTLFAMTRGVWRAGRWAAAGKDLKQLWRPHFPFTPGLRNLLIQLGLLGTIFAFIVAFNDLAKTSAAKEASYNPAVLIAPLGTALWSTFAGIAFAFLVLPPVEVWFARAMGMKEEGPDVTAEEVDAVSLAMEELERKGLRSAKALASLSGEVEALNQSLGGVNKSRELLEGLHGVLKLLHAASGELKVALVSTGEALTALPGSLQELTRQMRAAGAELELERQAVRDLMRSTDGSAQSLAVLADPQTGVRAVNNGLSGLGAGLRDLAEALREPSQAPVAWQLDPPWGRELTALRSDLARVEVDVKVLARGLRPNNGKQPHLFQAFKARLQRRRAAP